MKNTDKCGMSATTDHVDVKVWQADGRTHVAVLPSGVELTGGLLELALKTLQLQAEAAARLINFRPDGLMICKIDSDDNVVEITPTEFPVDLLDTLQPVPPAGLPVLCWCGPNGETDYSDTFSWLAVDADDVYVVSTSLSAKTRKLLEEEGSADWGLTVALRKALAATK